MQGRRVEWDHDVLPEPRSEEDIVEEQVSSSTWITTSLLGEVTQPEDCRCVAKDPG